jgi:tetratricopeptide (TPR) repeat protein
MFDQEPWFDRTHNIVLDWLIAGGLLGFLSYLAIFFSLLFTLFKKSNFSKSEKAVFFGALVAYGFHNLFVFDQIGSYILFFSMLAFIHSNSETLSPDWAKNISSKFSFWEKPNILPLSASVIVILFLSGMYFWQFIPWRQNKNIMVVLAADNQNQILPIGAYKTPLKNSGLGFPEALEHISGVAVRIRHNPQANQELKQEVFNAVNTAFQKQINNIPNDARYRLFYGLFLESLGDKENSLTQLEEAKRLSPNKQGIYFEIGSNLLDQGRKTEALEVFKKAYELEPSYGEARFVYGLVALSVGDGALSQKLLKDFDRNKIVFDDRYISVLAKIGRFDEIIQIAKERVESNPVNMQYRITLAAAYLQAGQRESAVSVIQEMIKIDPAFKEKGDYYISEIRAGRNP